MFCELGGFSSGGEDTRGRYRTISVGTAVPPMFSTVNGNNVMIPHRCLGLVADSGTIYVIHIAGGDTLATSHIPAAYVNKNFTNPNNTFLDVIAKLNFLSEVLIGCESNAPIDVGGAPPVSLIPGW